MVTRCNALYASLTVAAVVVCAACGSIDAQSPAGDTNQWLRPVVLVATDVSLQRKRIQERDGLSEAEAQRHIDAQMSLDEKRKLADYVIENNGTLEELEERVKAVVEKIAAT